MLFCRLLQIFHPDPVGLNLSIFLTKVRKDFAPLIERATKVRQVKPNESLNTGGEAFLTDAVDMVTSLFIGDGEATKQVVRMLRPKNVSVEDFVLFLISHRMVKMGVTPDDIFTMIDADGGGTLD